MKNLFFTACAVFLFLTSFAQLPEKKQWFGRDDEVQVMRGWLNLPHNKNNATQDSTLTTDAEGNVILVDKRWFALYPLHVFDSAGVAWVECINCGGSGGPVTLQDAIDAGNVLTKNDTIIGNAYTMFYIADINAGYTLRVKNNNATGSGGGSIFGESTGRDVSPIVSFNYYSGTPFLSGLGSHAGAGIYAHSLAMPGLKGYSESNAGVVGFGKTYAFYGVQDHTSGTTSDPAFQTIRYKTIETADTTSWVMGFKTGALGNGNFQRSLQVDAIVENADEKNTGFLLSVLRNANKKNVLGGGSDGSLIAHNYGYGDFLNTMPNYLLGVDGNNKVVEVPADGYGEYDMSLQNWEIPGPGVYHLTSSGYQVILPDPGDLSGKKIVIINDGPDDNEISADHYIYSADGAETMVFLANTIYTIYSVGTYWVFTKAQ